MSRAHIVLAFVLVLFHTIHEAAASSACEITVDGIRIAAMRLSCCAIGQSELRPHDELCAIF
jgi:hypothetical protein